MDNPASNNTAPTKYVPPHRRDQDDSPDDGAQPPQSQQLQRRTKEKKQLQRKADTKLIPKNAVLLPASELIWKDDMTLVDYALNECATTYSELIVLDLNGTLLKRCKANKGKQRLAFPRPYLQEFLKFATENFAVMIWSTAQPSNVNNMVSLMLSPYYERFVRVWDRRFCDLRGNYFSKSPSIKDLRKITGGFTLADAPNRNVYGTYDGYLGVNLSMRRYWEMENIILVDDSESKAELQKENHIFISSFEDITGESDDKELLKLTQYLQRYLQNKKQYRNLVTYMSKNPWPEFQLCSDYDPIVKQS
ncbi:hypothetical protein GGI23_004840 [Coemansia sp. RSA 2559]|nr:hypothetical protein GGI23_004840 [Coemansia sp. RSA 2559]